MNVLVLLVKVCASLTCVDLLVPMIQILHCVPTTQFEVPNALSINFGFVYWDSYFQLS